MSFRLPFRGTIMAFVLALPQSSAEGQANVQNKTPSAGVAKPAEPPLRRISTIPAEDYLILPAPQSVVRHPPWREVERAFAWLRRQRKERGVSFDDLKKYYQWLASLKSTGSEDYAQHVERLASWKQELPKSSTARVALACAYKEYAWEARGSGYASTVTEEGWKLFRERIGTARELLDEAVRLGVEDGEAYRLLIVVAMAEGAPKDRARALLDAGRKLDPTYYTMYEAMGAYLLPRWNGEPGETEDFAAEMAKALPGDNGLEAFGRIVLGVFTMDGNFAESIFYGSYDHDLLVRSSEVLLTRHGSYSPALPHFAALCALLTQDHAAAKRILPVAGPYQEAHEVWLWEQSYKHFRKWAAADESPSDETHRFWASQAGCMGIAFAPNANYVWCAQQFGLSSVNLVDVRTGQIRSRIPHPGGVLTAVAFGSRGELVALEAREGPLVGWMLWDAQKESVLKVHPTQETLGSLAVHPKRPHVFWSDSNSIRSWDTAADKAGLEIPATQVAHGLRFSADGSMLAADLGPRLVVFDPDTGNVKFELPRFGMKPQPEIHCSTILGFDSENRVLALAQGRGRPDSKRFVVRVATDGGKWERVLTDLECWGAVLSPDCQRLAVIDLVRNDSKPCGIDVWSITTGKKIKRLGGHWNQIRHAVFSNDGRKLATVGSEADVVKVWSLDDLFTK